ncbi:cytochrome c nitrite reductase small subunit [Pelagicoccus sp. SDUM812003]|uniref:cytochrome c nitrite reductase small subunit n=1 Tax=Pelagicoccus sp. SDUM812003 TaxID=3041267 RepID=UPI00280D4D35|nr:cytochrome c nitrite reductase small subunit [Pelagicoccus sp. SDUM812003]MDQ8202925.1 cytochrome c nitrite reductase small subunit [Pelagicoccus sp. SDUM812003]
MSVSPPDSDSEKPSLWKRLSPSPAWRLPLILSTAILLGLGCVLLRVSNATSYLSDEPSACVNCHIMNPQYATWERGSHARVATCNDCHVPHDNLANKYYFKAKDGLRHAFMFTFHMEPQVIKVHEPGMGVVQQNCIRCHENLLNHTPNMMVTFEESQAGHGKLCWDCHSETPHGSVNSLSATEFARTPDLDSVMPEWMQNHFSNPNEEQK